MLLMDLENFFEQFPSSQYKKHDTLLYAEDQPTSVFYLKSGFVRAYKISDEGEELTLMILKPNDFFPLTIGLAEMQNCYYLEAVTEVELVKAPNEKFINFLKENPDILYSLTSQVLNRFGGLLTRMEYLVVSRAYIKVASTLLMCAKAFGEKKGDGVIVKVPLTHKDIANLSGITRETTCLEMKKLEAKGLIEKFGKILIVKNMSKLEAESSTIST